ncbi:hypothetical protein IAU59_002162 [Kwoniella sp. CBS 9459]
MNEAGPSGSGSMSNPIPTSTTTMPIAIESQTFQSCFHTLLLAHNSKNLSLTHLHPFVSGNNGVVTGKGKGRAGNDGDEAERIRSLREALTKMREVLNTHTMMGQNAGMGEAERLVRGLREVTTHQSALLNSSTPLLAPGTNPSTVISSATMTSSSHSPLFASSLQLLPPITLLQNLSTSLGLQAFIEDSQFGLLKSSLAIAGNRVVVDVDLETDTPMGGEDEDMDEDTRAGSPSTPLPSAVPFSNANANAREAEKERGKVRLSKLVANHVTASGGTGKSEAITRLLRRQIELYLKLWNGDNSTQSQGPSVDEKGQAQTENPMKVVWEKEECIHGLRSILAELKEIDDMAAQSQDQTQNGSTGRGASLDMFEVVEKGIDHVEKLKGGQGNVRLYSSTRNSIYPTFHFLPTSAPASSDEGKARPTYNPTFRLRPTRSYEEVSTPFSEHALPGSEAVEGDESDQNMDERWSDGDWVLEVSDDETGAGEGLVVRRNWLSGEDDGTLGEGIRVENLLYRPFPSSTYLQLQAQPFPYTSAFVHTSPSGFSEGDNEKPNGGQKEQHWSIAQPGPQAFVLQKIGVPKSAEGLANMIKALRRQVVLNSFFAEVFVAIHLQTDTTVDIEDEDEGIDDLLDGPQNTIPITAVLHQSSVEVSVPLLDSQGRLNNLQLVVRYDEEAADEGYVKVEHVSQTVDGGQDIGGDGNLVRLVGEVIATTIPN